MTPQTQTQPTAPRRVRVKNDPRVTGEVVDTDVDGRVMWVSDDGKFCHFSAPDYLEPCS